MLTPVATAIINDWEKLSTQGMGAMALLKDSVLGGVDGGCPLKPPTPWREAQTAKRLGDDAGAAGALALPVEQRGAGRCSGNPWHEWAGISPD